MLTSRPRRTTFTAEELAHLLAAVCGGAVDFVGGDVAVVVKALELTRGMLVGSANGLPQQVRAFTDRECASYVGATVGGLLSTTDATTVRRAVRWWAKRPQNTYVELRRQVLGAMNAD